MSAPPPITPARWLLLAWLALHLFTMTVSMAKDTAFGKMFRPYTDPYQWRVGVHQNWTMYAPNPRLSTTWLEYTGIHDDKSEVPLELFIGRPDPLGIQTHYEREGKLERNAVSRKHIRASFVRWYCRTSKEAGKGLRQIRVEKVAVHTPPPEDFKPRSEWRETRNVLETWNCKR